MYNTAQTTNVAALMGGTTGAAPVNTVAPVISGSAIAGNILTTTDGTWTGTPTPTFTYQWQRNGSNITGATNNTYASVQSDFATTITCVVTGTNTSGSANATSNGIVITAAPVNTVLPFISGILLVGQVQTATTGTWTGTATITYTYQWTRNGSNIGSATSSTYTTVSADVGTTLACVVTGTNTQGSSSATSNTEAIGGMQTALLIAAGPTTGPSNSAKRYLPMVAGTTGGLWQAPGSIGSTATPMPVAGTVSNLWARLPPTLTNPDTWTFTVFKGTGGGTPTATSLKVTIDSTGIVKSDLADSVHFAVGDTICIESSPNGTSATPGVVQIGAIFQSDADNISPIFTALTTLTSAASAPFGATAGAGNTAAIWSNTMPTAGTIDNMQVNLTAVPGTGNTKTFTLTLNGVAQSLLVSYSAAQSGIRSMLATPITVAAGDVVTITYSFTGTATAGAALIGCSWTPTTTVNEGLAFGMWSAGVSNTGTGAYTNFNGVTNAVTTIETNTQNIAPFDLDITSGRYDLSTATGASKTRVATLDVNASASSVTATITNAATANFTNLPHSVSAGDLLDVITVPTGTPATTTWSRVSFGVKVHPELPTVAFSPNDLAGFVFDKYAATTPTLTLGGTYVSAPTQVQVRVVDGGNTPYTSYKNATFSGGLYSANFTAADGLTGNGPFYQQVRDNGGPVTTSIADVYFGAVIWLWGRSQADRLYEFPGGDTLAPTAASLGMFLYNGAGQKGSLNTPNTPAIKKWSGGQGTLTGAGGIIAMANQWQADTTNVPQMTVDCTWPGLQIENFLNDATLTCNFTSITGGPFSVGENVSVVRGGTNLGNYTTASGTTGLGIVFTGPNVTFNIQIGDVLTGLTSGATGTVTSTYNVWSNFITNSCNASKNQCTMVLTYHGDAGDTDPIYYNDLIAGKNKFDTLCTAGIKNYAMIPHMRSNNGAATWDIRNQTYRLATTGGAPYELAGWVPDIVMDSNGSPHQVAGATGNQRAGLRIGRGAANVAFSSSLSIQGPILTSATLSGGNSILLTFDRTVQTPSAATTGILGINISTDSGATYGDPPTTFTAAITASNQVTLTRTSGPTWVTLTTYVDFFRGVPFNTGSAPPGVWTGIANESTMEANVLDLCLYDTSGFQSGRGLPVTPIMGSGFQVV